MSRRPVLHRRPLHTGALLLAVLGVGTMAAPAALAMVDPSAPVEAPTQAPDAPHVLTNSPAAYLGTPEQPVEFGFGKLFIEVQPEPGAAVPADADLSGATVRLTDTTPPDEGQPRDLVGDDSSIVCTTDAEGDCEFLPTELPFLVPGATFTIEQLTPPTSGVFQLPSAADRVVYGEVPAITTAPTSTTAASTTAATTTPTTTPTTTTATTTTTSTTTTSTSTTTTTTATTTTDELAAGLVRRVAPDVAQQGPTNTVVFYDPLVTTAPASTTAATTIPSSSAPAATTATTTAAAAATAAPTRPALATTGAEVVPMLAVGGTLLAAGAGGLVLARRRTTR